MDAKSLDKQLKSIVDLNISSSYYTEAIDLAVDNTTINKIIISIKRLILEIATKAKQFKKHIEFKIKEKHLKTDLKNIRDNLKERKEAGVRKVEFIDYDKFNSYFHTYAFMIEDKINKLSKLEKFKHKSTFENSVREAEELIIKFDKDLHEYTDHPTKMSIDKAITFVEKEINGQSVVWKSYLDVMERLNKYAYDLEKYAKLSNIVTEKYMVKQHIGIIRRLLHKFCTVISKHSSKFVSTVVFFFA